MSQMEWRKIARGVARRMSVSTACPTVPALRRVLRAIAAVRAGDEVRLANATFRIALDRAVRARLAAALRALAPVLAAAGLAAPAGAGGAA